jgi:hypothetical protein
MSKMNRERELREKRALKQERKDQKKLAAAAAGIPPRESRPQTYAAHAAEVSASPSSVR